MQQSSQALSSSMKFWKDHPMNGHIFSPMTYRNPLMPSVPTNIPMGAMQTRMNPGIANNGEFPYALTLASLYQNGTAEQANILANFRMGNITQRQPYPRPLTDTNKTKEDDFGNFQVLPYGYWDYRAVLLHNMPACYNISEFINLGRFGTLERIVPLYERNQLFVTFLSAADAFDFYNTVRYTDFVFMNQRLIVSTIDFMPLEQSIMEACRQGFTSRNVQITGFPSDFDEAALFQYVCSLGKAELISVSRNTNSIYVHYLSITDALHCIDSLLSHPYYRILNSCCYYERCDRYYPFDFQVEKTVPSSNFVKSKGVSTKNVLKESSIQSRSNHCLNKSTVKNPFTHHEHKSNPINPSSWNKNVFSEKETALTSNKQRVQPDRTTKTNSTAITESQQIQPEINESFPDSNISHKNDSTTIPSNQSPISVVNDHSKNNALQNVTNPSCIASDLRNSAVVESTEKSVSSTSSSYGNESKSQSLHVRVESEISTDKIAFSTLNTTNVTIYDTANEEFSGNLNVDINMDNVTKEKDKTEISKEDKKDLFSATSDSNSSSEKILSSNENYTDSKKEAEKDFPSFSSSMDDKYTEKESHAENSIIAHTPTSFESSFDTDSPPPLRTEHTSEDSIYDLRTIPKLTIELSSSRSSSVLTSPTLVGSPLDTHIKSLSDFSEFALDSTSKPYTNQHLAIDLDPCYKNRTLFLSKIHKAAKQPEISRLFQMFPIEEVRHFPKKRMCFVTFLESYDAKIFLEAHQKQPVYLHGRPVRLEWAKSDNPFTDDLLYAISNGASRSITFMMNHSSFTRSELVSVFKKYGDIESFLFTKKSNSGSVTYSSIYGAIKAMESLQSHSTFQTATIEFAQNDRHDLLNSPYNQHFPLPQEKISLSKELLSFSTIQKLSSCFPTHDSNYTLRSKNIDTQPTTHAIISANG
ncbi:meiotically up-regulated 24 protein [Schizosaccharomyces octosporus yFS286]|uniref:Meiotically up-regulated 24 protein n=1 Tax=Schizosaccharomyces octosporus (strain yFS286) TaxID=483514 RepID=S9Q095_SCHOY|nr:meiotically up-regulated 24 protein [Schizosaccharomyces octosporus yFS286]EPX73123.1 meiotically up-regulated 24 protein [Schizosaccharomyces octosporus yFS286]